ncbi:MAG TPA: hypothetical protein VMU50_19910, partial [Polyangia bacterium]|nr:hypothetical protein [Polyangia bacterium]
MGGLSATLFGGCQKEEGAAMHLPGDGDAGDLTMASTGDGGRDGRDARADGPRKDLASDTGDGSAGRGDTVPDAPPIAEPPADGGVDSPVTYHGHPWNGTPAVVPGTIQASLYDTGGEGVAYHDTDLGNTGARMAMMTDPTLPEAKFRTGDNVDLRSTRAGTDHSDDGTPVDAGKLYISWTQYGEWVNYTIDVKQ